MVEKQNFIHLIKASAGTGKTFRMSGEYQRIIQASGKDSASKLIATTFTKKASLELIARIRQRLLDSDNWEAAQAIHVANVGTVNSVCGRIVSELSMDAGKCPSVKIIAEQDQLSAIGAATDEIVSDYEKHHWSMLQRLGKEYEWRDDLIQIVELARQNCLDGAQLLKSAELSWTRYIALFPEQKGNKQSFEVDLLGEIKNFLDSVPAVDDKTKATESAVISIKEFNRDWMNTGSFSWAMLANLLKLKCGKVSSPALNKLKALVSAHLCLPEFHRDLRELISSIFQCAADCMDAYRDFKAKRGLLDFIDQEQAALAVLTDVNLRGVFESQYSALLVDEFQDTNPIQLAIFLELAKITKSSLWVGDEKQSIYGFRGSDPKLVEAVVDALVPETGGAREVLSTSYRSRPELVNFINKLFGAMERFYAAPLNCARGENKELSVPLNIWWLSGSNENTAIRALVAKIKRILEMAKDFRIELAGCGTRKLQGSDIAILCRSNETRLEIAEELNKAGILVSTERPGLLETPECSLVLAVLRYLSDRYDTLAMAEILRFSNELSEGQEWLYALIADGIDKSRQQNKSISSLDEIRGQIAGLSPFECLQFASTTSDVIRCIKEWGNARQRFLNLEALLGLGKTYEDFCDSSRNAATIGGLITYLSKYKNKFFQPPNPSEDAVHVLTYHKSKGLEWPFVVMYDLDKAPNPILFGVQVFNDGDLDFVAPLANRSIRYWPWPYGHYNSTLELASVAALTPEAKESIERAREEELRLIYVGMTRARDYLALACREKSGGKLLQEILVRNDGNSILEISPVRHGEIQILRDNPEITGNCELLLPDELLCPGEGSSIKEIQLGLGDCVSREFEPYAIVPSSTKVNTTAFIARVYELGGRIRFGQTVDENILGNSIHLFLAVDDDRLSDEKRIAIAAEIVAANGLEESLAAQFFLASQNLRNRMEELYPNGLWHTEWPVGGRLNGQRVKGTIDLLIELPECFVLIDHKSFPGTFEEQKERALGYFSQLAIYSKLIEQASEKPVLATYIHMPVVGTFLLLKPLEETAPSEKAEVQSSESNWIIF